MMELGSLGHLLRRLRRRLRFQRAAGVLAWTAVASVSAIAAHTLATRLGASLPSTSLLALIAAPPLAALASCAWPIHLARAARLLDGRASLTGRAESALSFARESAPTPFMRAAVRDAVARAADVNARDVFPIHAPRTLAYLAPAAALWALGAWLPLPAPSRGVPPPPSATSPRTSLDPETLEALAADRARLLHPEREATRALVERYAELLTQLSRGELSREDALRELRALQQRLDAARDKDGLLVDGVRRLARALARDRVRGALASALAQGDLRAAATALEELARRLATGEMPPREREALARALAKLERETEADGPEGRGRAPDPEPSLLRKKRDEAGTRGTPDEAEDRDDARRELERLRRSLQNAAAESPGAAADSLRDAADQARSLAQRQADAEQRERLQQQLEQLRQELLRKRSGDERGPAQRDEGERGGDRGAQSQSERMQRFRLRAGGGSDSQTPLVVPRADAGPDESDPRDAGTGAGDDDGDAGDAGEQPRQKALALGGEGPPGATLEMPGGRETRTSTRSGESDSTTRDRPTPRSGETQDRHVQGVAGAGPSRSQVIVGAAERGFATTPYRDVYTDYRTHAEDVLERDAIPPGYRFYVRRYFQLIRPREEEPSP